MEVETVDTGQRAVDRAMSRPFDLVMLDVVMPDLGGLECCRLLKAKTAKGFLPIVMVTVRDSPEQRVEGLRIGADDYVGKPFDEREVIERLSALLRVKHLHDELAAARAKLEELAVHDELTGLYNYRYLRSRLEEEFKRSRRYKSPLTCVVVDVDGFKAINDEHGHDAGNEVLRELARRVCATVREVDVVARYGGEEFLVILPETDGTQGVIAAERICTAVAEAPVVVAGVDIGVTVSAGVAHVSSGGVDSRDDLIGAADRALLGAKQQGHNQVRMAESA